MREYKFRAWIGNKMEYSVGVFNGRGYYCATDPHDTASLLTTIYTDNIPIMQFTGLKDKNGREIYEGDIIHCGGDDPKFKVSWSKQFCAWDCEGVGLHELAQLGIMVIGNTYENPELLK